MLDTLVSQALTSLTPRLAPQRVQGCHGTSSERCERILVEGFLPGNDSGLRLGPGVYFFDGQQPDGIPAWKLAFEFAHAVAGHTHCGVLQATLQLEQMLDLEALENQKVFRAIRRIVGCHLSDLDDSMIDQFMAARGLAGRDFMEYLDPITVSALTDQVAELHGLKMCISTGGLTTRVSNVICVRPHSLDSICDVEQLRMGLDPATVPPLS